MNALTPGPLIAFGEAYGIDAGVGNFATVSAGAPSIWRVEIYQPTSGFLDGIVLDDLVFSSDGDQGSGVPDGGTSAILLGLSLLGLAGARRKMLS